MRDGRLVTPFSSLRMALPCAPASMNSRIAASDAHAVAVQNVFRRSASNLAAKLPAAARAWRSDRNVYTAKPGINRQERTRNRVIETKVMGEISASSLRYYPLLTNVRPFHDASPRIVHKGSVC